MGTLGKGHLRGVQRGISCHDPASWLACGAERGDARVTPRSPSFVREQAKSSHRFPALRTTPPTPTASHIVPRQSPTLSYFKAAGWGARRSAIPAMQRAVRLRGRHPRSASHSRDCHGGPAPSPSSSEGPLGAAPRPSVRPRQDGVEQTAAAG